MSPPSDDAPSILPLARLPQNDAYTFTVGSEYCVGPPGNVFLFGGAGLASAVSAMEQSSGRHLICATAQYISYARAGDQLEITAQHLANGKQISQMQARVGHGDKAVLMVTAALGDRDGWPEFQWSQAPDMLPPDLCEDWQIWPNQAGGLLERLEVRLEPSEIARLKNKGQIQPHGHLRYWLKPRNNVAIDSALLAIAADFIPSGVGAAFGRLGGGNSLDNVLRIGRIVPTNWLKCDVEIDIAQRGFAQGSIKIYAESGELMATGSQSLALRFLEN